MSFTFSDAAIQKVKQMVHELDNRPLDPLSDNDQALMLAVLKEAEEAILGGSFVLKVRKDPAYIFWIDFAGEQTVDNLELLGAHLERHLQSLSPDSTRQFVVGALTTYSLGLCVRSSKVYHV